MTLWMGKLEVKIMHVGPGHTKGDTIVWVPQRRCCSRATWSRPMPPATPAMPTRRVAGDARCAGGARCRKTGARSRPGADEARRVSGRPGLHPRFRQHPAQLSAQEAVAQGMNLKQAHGAYAQGDGPEIRPGFHLRALFALRRNAGGRRGEWHQASRASGRQSATRRCGTVCKRRSKTPAPERGGAKDNKRRQKC
jgi:hypothetical protein